jgi:8-oxo-dGTP diphosphatase
VKARAAVILIQTDKIALIERYRSGRHYFVFPGGKIEPGETASDAAAREAYEELGLEVNTGRMVAEVWYLGTPQYYYLAEATGGRFGHGIGRELASLPGSEKGTYHPVWMPLSEITQQEVLPKLVARLVTESNHSGWPKPPLVVTDHSPDASG